MNPCVGGGYDCEPRNDTNLRSGTVLDENQVSTLRARINIDRAEAVIFYSKKNDSQELPVGIKVLLLLERLSLGLRLPCLTE